MHRLTSVNPVKIAFNEWGHLIHDVRNAKGWRQGLKAAFGYPGDKKAVLEEQARLRAQRSAAKPPGEQAPVTSGSAAAE